MQEEQLSVDPRIGRITRRHYHSRSNSNDPGGGGAAAAGEAGGGGLDIDVRRYSVRPPPVRMQQQHQSSVESNGAHSHKAVSSEDGSD